jgi:small subunit ribosomal protein S20
MANIKANIKNIGKTQRRHARNKSAISKTRSSIKMAKASNKPQDLASAYKKVDATASKGRIHKNKANRIKSRMAKLLTRITPKNNETY